MSMENMDAFFQIHSDLPREGPGDLDSLTWALSQIELPTSPRVLDAGCGPGADIAGLLTHRPLAQIVAVEAHAPFVDRVRQLYAGDDRVEAVLGDMARPEGRYDLIWCAGALYFLGVEAGLTGWRDHLNPGGAVIFSELSWTGAPRSAEAQAFWTDYAAMQDEAGVLAATRRAGFTVKAHQFLPRAAWAAYYEPVQARVDQLWETGPDAALAEALEAEQAEIDLWRAHGNEYGYLLVVAETA